MSQTSLIASMHILRFSRSCKLSVLMAFLCSKSFGAEESSVVDLGELTAQKHSLTFTIKSPADSFELVRLQPSCSCIKQINFTDKVYDKDEEIALSVEIDLTGKDGAREEKIQVLTKVAKVPSRYTIPVHYLIDGEIGIVKSTLKNNYQVGRQITEQLLLKSKPGYPKIVISGAAKLQEIKKIDHDRYLLTIDMGDETNRLGVHDFLLSAEASETAKFQRRYVWSIRSPRIDVESLDVSSAKDGTCQLSFTLMCIGADNLSTVDCVEGPFKVSSWSSVADGKDGAQVKLNLSSLPKGWCEGSIQLRFKSEHAPFVVPVFGMILK